MELVLAVPTLHRGNTPISGMEHTVTDVALFDSCHLLVDIAFPKQNSGDNITVPRLDKIANRKSPLPHLLRLELQLIPDINNHRFKWIISRDPQSNLSIDFLVLSIRSDDLVSRPEQLEGQLRLIAQLSLRELDLLDLVLENCG